MKHWIAGVLLGATVAAASAGQDSCPGDYNRDGTTTIDEIVAAVDAVLNGCASSLPPPTCPPPPAGRTCTPYETYTCVADEFGCPICDCCNFEGVGGCCQLSDGCFQLTSGQDAAECVVNRHGSIVPGCPVSASCDAAGHCGQIRPSSDPPRCPGDDNGDGETTVDEIIAAISAALDGCPETPSPPAATATSSSTPTTTVPDPTPTECVDTTVPQTGFRVINDGRAEVVVEAADDCCWYVQEVALFPQLQSCPSDLPGMLREVRCGSSVLEKTISCVPGVEYTSCYRLGGHDVTFQCARATPALTSTATRIAASPSPTPAPPNVFPSPTRTIVDCGAAAPQVEFVSQPDESRSVMLSGSVYVHGPRSALRVCDQASCTSHALDSAHPIIQSFELSRVVPDGRTQLEICTVNQICGDIACTRSDVNGAPLIVE